MNDAPFQSYLLGQTNQKLQNIEAQLMAAMIQATEAGVIVQWDVPDDYVEGRATRYFVLPFPAFVRKNWRSVRMVRQVARGLGYERRLPWWFRLYGWVLGC